MLAGGLAAAACALALDERDLLRIGLFAVVLPLAAALAGRVRRVRLSATHLVQPTRLDPATAGQVHLSVTNNGSTRTSALEIQEGPTAGLTPGFRCLLPPLRPRRQARTTYPLRAERRGRYLLGPPTVRISDPFGLWEEYRTLPARSEVLVVPAVVALAGVPPSTGSRSAAADRSSTGSAGGDPDVGVRVYRNGDDIRTIHWRASARHDELLVRLQEPVSHGGATVMLDHRAAAHRGEGNDSSLEPAVTLAASIALHLLQDDHQVRLSSHSGAVLASGRDIADDVLAALAVVEPDPAPSLSPASVAGSGLVIAILSVLAPSDAKVLAASRKLGTNGLAMVLEPASFGPHRTGGNDQAVAILRESGWRVVTVRTDENLATAWTRACSDRFAATSSPASGPSQTGRAAPAPVPA